MENDPSREKSVKLITPFPGRISKVENRQLKSGVKPNKPGENVIPGGIAAESAAFFVLFLVLVSTILFFKGYTFGDCYVGGGGTGRISTDWNGHFWNLWNHGTDQSTLFHTKNEFYPHGIDTVFIHEDLLVNLAGGFVSRVAGVDIAHLFVILFIFAGNGAGGYFFLRTLTGRVWPGLLAGFFLAFSPAASWAVNTGNFQVGLLFFLAVYAGFLYRTIENGGLANAALAGIFAGLAIWSNFTHHVHLLLLTSVFCLFRIRIIFRDRLPELLCLAIVVMLFSAPLLSAYLDALDNVPGPISPRRPAPADILKSPDFNLSMAVNHLVPGFMAGPASPEDGVMCKSWYFVYILLAAALLADWRRALPWVAASAVFLLFSMGPHLTLLSETGDRSLLSPFLLPYGLICKYFPFFQRIQFPHRFYSGALLSYSAIAGIALAGISRYKHSPDNAKSKARFVRFGKILAVITVFSWLALELLLPWDIRISKHPPVNPVYDLIAGDVKDGAVIEYPFNFIDIDDEYLYNQTRHGRPLFNGLVPPFIKSDPTGGLLEKNAFIGKLTVFQEEWFRLNRIRPPAFASPFRYEEMGVAIYAAAIEELLDAGFMFLVFHTRIATESGLEIDIDQDKIAENFLRTLLDEPIYADSRAKAFYLSGNR